MKTGVITDGISRDFEHALNVMDEFGLQFAELQFVWDKEVGFLEDAEVKRSTNYWICIRLRFPTSVIIFLLECR